MPQSNDFRFSLVDKDGDYWQVVSGSVVKNSTPYYLEFSPAGWDDISIQNVRNKNYWGIDRSVTVPLSYVNDAAFILKHIFYTLGIEENVYLKIESQKLNYTPSVSYGYTYDQIYLGSVDLSTFNHAGAKVSCTLLEDGLPKYLKANENTVYEFPFDVDDAVKVKLDGINLHEKLIYNETPDTEIHVIDYGENFWTPTYFIRNEGDSVGILKNSQALLSIGGTTTWDQKLASDNCIIRNVGNTAISLTLTGTIEFLCTAMVSSPAYAIRFRFIRSNQLLANQNDYQIFSTGLVVGNTYTQDYSITIPIDINEKLFLEGIYFGGVGTDAAIAFTNNSHFDISFLTRQRSTTIKAFPLQYLFEQLISKVTEGNYTGDTSNFFSTYEQIVLTSGNAIRGLDDATMKISFSDFFKFCDSISAVGIIENPTTVGLETKEDLIDLDNVIELGEIGADSLKVTVAKEYLFNELEIGYPEIKNDVGVLNGNEEFNDKMLFSLGTTKSPARLSKVSPVKASCYEIEKIRVTTLEKETTDYKADNDNFALVHDNVLHESEYYELDRSLNAGATGLIEPDTVFNLFISPKRNLLRNMAFINSSLYKADGKILEFISADKNNKVVSDTLIEKANMLIGSLGDKFFIPILFDLIVNAPGDLLDLLDTNPLQIFSYDFHGDNYKGILVKASVAPSNRKEQGYQLLSIDQDLESLIKNYGGI